MRFTPDQFMASLDFGDDAEVYRVGGSVRDEILGRQSKDSDYMVRNVPLDRIAAPLRDSAALAVTPLRLRDGREVGVRAHVKGLGLLEIVLPRTEISTGPGHRDFEIVVRPDLELFKDAERRDFTINALYRNVKTGELVDPLGMGRTDLRDGFISTTHPDSFRDDPLRTLRALRFVSKLGFRLTSQTERQMHEHGAHVSGLTAAGYPSGTVLDEFSRLLMGSNPGAALRLGRDTGVLGSLLPELAPTFGYAQRSRYHDKPTDEHIFDAVQAAANMHRDAPLRVRWALLLHDIGKPVMAWRGPDGFDHYYEPSDADWEKIGAGRPFKPRAHEIIGARLAKQALTRLNAPKRLRDDVVTLVERHMIPLHQNIRPFKVRSWRAELGDEMLRDLFVHRLADVVGKGGDIRDAVDTLAWMEQVRADAKKRGVPLDAKGLAISGRDLLDLGLTGQDIGRVQRELLHEVIAQPKLNEREWLLTRAEALR